jgi:type II secretory pathway component PulF
MPQFAYVALDSRGQESTGFVEAVSTSDAIVQLRQAGYFPTGVYEEGQGVAPEKKSRPKDEDGPDSPANGT